VLITPGEEAADRPVIGHAGILVADGRGEEFQETTRGVLPASATIKGTTIEAATAAEILGALAFGMTVSWWLDRQRDARRLAGLPEYGHISWRRHSIMQGTQGAHSHEAHRLRRAGGARE
jgi:hypothetical protein